MHFSRSEDDLTTLSQYNIHPINPLEKEHAIICDDSVMWAANPMLRGGGLVLRALRGGSTLPMNTSVCRWVAAMCCRQRNVTNCSRGASVSGVASVTGVASVSAHTTSTSSVGVGSPRAWGASASSRALAIAKINNCLRPATLFAASLLASECVVIIDLHPVQIAGSRPNVP